MHYTQKGLSFLFVLTLCIQPVFAEELIPEEAILPVEAPTELPLTEATPNVSTEVAPLEEVESTSSEVTTPVSVTEFISASVEERITQMKSGVDAANELPLTESNYVEGEILVKYKDNKVDLTKTSGRRIASGIAKIASLEKKDEMRESNISLLEITDSDTVEEKIDELKNNPNVEYAQPNFIYTPSAIATNDPSGSLLWGLDNTGQNINGTVGKPNADINAPEAWAINEGTNATITVAVIDSGVAYNHPDLINNMWDGTNCKDENGNAINGGCNHGYDYEDDDVTPLPTYSSHGTHIAGTIAAVKNNTVGISGIAPSAKIMAIRAGDSQFTSDKIIRSINFAKQNGAHIINASWGGYGFDQGIYDAIQSFPGLFIAAAGNSAHDNDDASEINHTYPSDFNLSNIVSVAATDQNDGLAQFSNFGATSVDIGAPGTNIYSTVSSKTALSETFESVVLTAIPDGWTKGGIGNDWGTLFIDGSKVLFNDIENEFYHSNRDTYVTSPTTPLNLDQAYMSFSAACDTEYSSFLWMNHSWIDYMQLEFSADGINFFPAIDPNTGQEFRWDEPTLDFLSGENPDHLNVEGFAYYFFPKITIPDQYLTSDFKFRLRWVTDPHATYDYGCFIDDLQITELSEDVEGMYSFSDGTSMAAPHVAGLAALIEGYNPNLRPVEVKDIILSTGDTQSSLVGKTVTGMRINAENALRSAGTINTIIGFTIPTQASSAVINEIDHTISVQVPFGTDVTSLTPTVTITGGTVTPASGVTQDFTLPVLYTVTGLNGSSTQDYVVTITVAPAPPVVKATRSSSSGGGGGGGSSKKKTTVKIAAPVAPLTSVGTSTIIAKKIFTLQNSIGARNQEVTELQKILIKEGFLKVAPATGYFGSLTQFAVASYQRTHGLPGTGVVDEATRAKLNGTGATTAADTQKAALIKTLQAKLLELIAELQALKAH